MDDRDTQNPGYQQDQTASQDQTGQQGQQDTAMQGSEAGGDSWKSDSANQETGQASYGNSGETAQGDQLGTQTLDRQQDGLQQDDRQTTSELGGGLGDDRQSSDQGFIGSQSSEDESDQLINRNPPLDGE
ncbi:hypothetical protein ABDK56_11200 [Sphingomonas sp. ASV193]|uniref:hypothetical protein n=1 Tax=Sphingomonas sp. ASV193 TaxID=3144405 RepID=UPI0032E85D88